MDGKMKGQAFVTFPDVQRATKALEELTGYKMAEKPLLIVRLTVLSAAYELYFLEDQTTRTVNLFPHASQQYGKQK
jgi:RNA recognition motif-containing protein